MSDSSEVLAEARLRAANGDTEGAIRALRGALTNFTGELEDRRKIVTLLLAYCGKREKLNEGMLIAADHLEIDPISIIDSSTKARLVMNYAALTAASGDTSQAIALLGDILICSESSTISQEDISRIEVMMKSLQVAIADASDTKLTASLSYSARAQAYLASAYVSRLIREGSFSEATRLAEAILERQRDLEDGPLKVTLLLNLGVALAGRGEITKAKERLEKAYNLATQCLMRGGTLFALVARSFAAVIVHTGGGSEAKAILHDLLEAQLVKLGDIHPDVIATKELLAQIPDD